MKTFARLLKWTFFLVLGLVVAVCITVALRQDLQFQAPLPRLAASGDSLVIARGHQLVYGAAHCASCHGPSNADSLLAAGIEAPLSGGRQFVLPIGVLHVPNITSDAATGIGQMSDGAIARSLYYGVGRKGQALFDVMPFHNVSEADMRAIISYLRTLPPVRHQVPDHEFNPLGMAVKAFMIKPVGPSQPPAPTVQADSSIAYGAYLTHNVANCAGCHTQRNLMTGAFTGPSLAGGLKFNEPGMPEFITPNLTPDPASRLAGWTEQQFVERMLAGRRVQGSPMPWESYARMNEAEAKAIFRYLKTVKAAPLPPLED